MKINDQKLLLTDIALKANVSLSTVSRVFNHPWQVKEATFERVYAAMEALGAEPNTLEAFRREKAARRKAVIMMLAGPTDDNPRARDVMRGINDMVAQNGYLSLVAGTAFFNEDNMDAAVNSLSLLNVAGVISFNYFKTEILEPISQRIPITQCCDVNTEVNTNLVTIKEWEASCQSVRHLVSRGCKRIAFVQTGPNCAYFSAGKFAAYSAALEEAGLPFDTGLVLELDEVNYQMSVSALSVFLQRAHPDGIFCCNDVFAAAALVACGQIGSRVPEDVKIIGFDNIDISTMVAPKLTTTGYARYQIGYTGCQMLLEQIDAPETPMRHVVMDTEFVVRDST